MKEFKIQKQTKNVFRHDFDLHNLEFCFRKYGNTLPENVLCSFVVDGIVSFSFNRVQQKNV